MPRSLCLVVVLVALVLAGSCTSDDDDDETPEPGDDDSDSGDDDEDPGEVSVAEEYVILDAPPAPPNPVTGAPTEPYQNTIAVIRMRADTGDAPPRAVKAILILFGGHTIGGNEFRHVAKQLVLLSGGEIEVWMQDRRTQFLEDNWGTEWGETLRDPQLAWDYYFNGVPIHGKTFAGFLDPKGPATDMESEWGLDVEMADIHRILTLIPEDVRSQVAFIGGHSRGVAFAEAYAAYRFPDGHRGTDDVAGVVLVDGGARQGGPETAAEYLQKIDDIRSGRSQRYTAIPLEGLDFELPISRFGAGLYVQMEILAMAGSEEFADTGNPEIGPDGVWSQDNLIRYLLWITNGLRRITATNEALFGILADNDTGRISLLTGRFGIVTGGAIEEKNGHLVLTDEDAVYSWIQSDELDPPEVSDLRLLCRGLYEGPSNTMDRYYSTRVDLDLTVAGYRRFETGGTWRDDFFNMRTSEVDAPIYAIASGLILGTPEFTGEYEAYRDLLAPVRGSDLPRTEAGFHLMSFPDWGHLDPIALLDGNVLYPDLANWLLTTSTGEVRIPRL